MRSIGQPAPQAQRRAWLGLGLLCVLGCAGLNGQAQAQFSGPDRVVARSLSGQFIILARAGAALGNLAPEWSTNRECLQVDPMVLPSSCERIKAFVWESLGLNGPWSGQVYVALHPAASPDETVRVVSQRFETGWQYRVDLPDVVQRTRLARALVELALLEVANRNAGARSAEIPTWLSEGMTRQLLLTREAEVMLQPPARGRNGVNLSSTLLDRVRSNPLTAAHLEFLNRAPLTFEQLSWPGPGQLQGAAGEVYADSAQLFVDALLGLRQGRACLRTMVQSLPLRYNWQFAFLQAYKAYFQRPLDVEKWWALEVVQFTGHSLGQTWPEAESWTKLDQAVRSAVEIRTGTNQLPLSSEIPLQSIIQNWQGRAQTQALQAKVQELRWLVPRLARQDALLAEDYCKVLESYLASRQRGGFLPFRKNAAQRQATQEALRELGMLDTRRLVLAPKAAPAAPLQAQAWGRTATLPPSEAHPAGVGPSPGAASLQRLR